MSREETTCLSRLKQAPLVDLQKLITKHCDGVASTFPEFIHKWHRPLESRHRCWNGLMCFMHLRGASARSAPYTFYSVLMLSILRQLVLIHARHGPSNDARVMTSLFKKESMVDASWATGMLNCVSSQVQFVCSQHPEQMRRRFWLQQPKHEEPASFLRWRWTAKTGLLYAPTRWFAPLFGALGEHCKETREILTRKQQHRFAYAPLEKCKKPNIFSSDRFPLKPAREKHRVLKQMDDNKSS